ncbi:MAG: V-type ATP synthase subunit D [Phycisphaerales bacterium]|nr:V-type ATP synthase subunit D [Phycisphaerales bacterium]
MAVKIKMTRPELKRYRDAVTRYERYLPMLQLKQQLLQMRLREVARARDEAERAAEEAAGKFRRYESVLADLSGVNPRELGAPREVRTTVINVAGVEVPTLDDVEFTAPRYSLFGTPAWVDQVVEDLRDLSRQRVALEIFDKQKELLNRELTRIIQRVNLFEKVKIPEAREAIRVIRIRLGDELTASVARAKIVKGKLAEAEAGESDNPADHSEVEEMSG